LEGFAALLSLFAVLSALSALVPESLELDDELVSDEVVLDEEPGFDDEYRSLYQPPPFKMNPVDEMMRSSLPPHFSHFFLGASLIDCVYSKRPAHLAHSYS
jgi:hypothetical protein